MARVLATLITSKSSKTEVIPAPVIIQPDQEMVIGRSSKCDLVYADVKPVSHIHCYMRNRDRTIEIKDVSSNKTLVDGKPIPKQEWVPVKDGAEVLLSQEPKVKFEVRIGSEPIMSKKRKSSAKHGSEAIARITSTLRSKIDYSVVLPSPQSDEVSITIGRGKECNIRIDDKKISSVHCKLHFKRIEGDSVRWSLEVASASKNKTYVGDKLVEESIRFEAFADPINIALVFQEKEKAIEVLTVEPILSDSLSSPEPLTAAEMIQQELEKEEKRRKKELHQLEKQSKEWQVRYKLDIEKLQETEHLVLLEIESLNKRIANKHKDTTKLREDVGAIELAMKYNEEKFSNNMDETRLSHEQRLAELTAEVNAVTWRLQKLNDEKIKIQMGQ